MPNKSYIPSRDSEFKLWSATLVTGIGSNPTGYGVSAGKMTALGDAQAKFDDDLNAHLAAQAAAKTATQTKRQSRSDFVDLIREVVKGIQANPAVTDAMKTAIGITVPDDHRTPAPVPTTHPIPQIEDIEPLTHDVRYADSASGTRAKPDGVRAAEVWMTILPAGAPIPTDPTGFELVDINSNGKFVQNFDAADATKTAAYRLRWLNSRNERGPWGPVVTATIAA
jgi:hypothetical protein